MDDMNDFECWALDDMNKFRSWAQGFKWYEQLKVREIDYYSKSDIL